MINSVWRYALGGHDRANLQAISSQSGDTLGGRDRLSLEIHLLGGRDQASLEIHLEALIERVWRYALGGHDRANLQPVITSATTLSSVRTTRVFQTALTALTAPRTL